MAFHLLGQNMMRRIITTMIRPKLEYIDVIWSMHKRKHVLKLERIQTIATQMASDLRPYIREKIKRNASN